MLLGVQAKYLDRIRGDSLARLSSRGLLGDMIINISVGSPDAPALKSGDDLRAAESEGLGEVVSSLQEGIGQVRGLVGHVDERVRTVLSDQVAKISVASCTRRPTSWKASSMAVGSCTKSSQAAPGRKRHRADRRCGADRAEPESHDCARRCHAGRGAER